MNLLVLLGMAFVFSRGFGLMRALSKPEPTLIMSVAFSVMAVGSMMVSFPIGPGIIGDFRNAVIAIASIIGGPVSTTPFSGFPCCCSVGTRAFLKL